MKPNAKSIIFLVISTTLLTVLILPIQRKHSPFSELRWQRTANLLAIDDMMRNGQRGLLMLRLTDGKEQFIIGQWRAHFTDSGNVIVTEVFPENATPMNKGLLYYFERGERIMSITVDKLPAEGRIIGASENPNATYLAIAVRTAKSGTLYCIVERIGSTPPSCKQLALGAITDARWNPDANHEFVMKTTSGQLFVYDPWKKKPEQLFADSDALRFQKLSKLFTPVNTSPRQVLGIHGTRTFWRFLGLLLVLDKQGWSWRRVPALARIAWLSDGEHVLLKTRNNLLILELATGKQTLVLTDPSMATRRIRFHNQTIDETL